MGLINWLMKGIDQGDQAEETKAPEFNGETIENLKRLSNSEMQESTTLNSHKESANMQNNNFIPQNGYMQNGNFSANQNGYMQNQNQGYAQPYNQYNTNPMQNNFGAPLCTTQNVYMQQSPNQPNMQTTITIFQVSSEEDIQYALMHLGKKSPCAISFNKMSRKKFDSLYQYLKGGVFALGAKVVKWNDSYLLTPRGMNITKQDKVKK